MNDTDLTTEPAAAPEEGRRVLKCISFGKMGRYSYYPGETHFEPQLRDERGLDSAAIDLLIARNVLEVTTGVVEAPAIGGFDITPLLAEATGTAGEPTA